MSHEGIRIVDEAEARRISGSESRLPREAVEPVKVRVHKSEGTGVEIDWKDGHRSAWTFRWLRDALSLRHLSRGAGGSRLDPRTAKTRTGATAAHVRSAAAPQFCRACRPVRAHLSLERWTLQWDLLMGFPASPLPVRGVPGAPALARGLPPPATASSRSAASSGSGVRCPAETRSAPRQSRPPPLRSWRR